MTTNAEAVFLLGTANPAFTSLQVQTLRTTDAIRKAFNQKRPRRWLVSRSRSLVPLVEAAAGSTLHRLLVLDTPTPARRELLGTLFRVVVAPGNGVHLLPTKEIADVLVSKHPEDFFIGGAVSSEDKALVLYQGSLERIVVPFSWFRASTGSAKPDFNDFEVIDGGQTVRLGTYEAAASAILYDFDVHARARMKKNLIEKDTTFGGALRRLRLTKGVSRDGFRGITAKTIARLERGEITNPHAKTLAKIARKLGVEPDEIKSF